jgi:hypothetical protein
MHIDIMREPTSVSTTIGRLLIDGRDECYTLEDPVREIPGEPVEAWKIAKITAIPTGIYRVTIDWSYRFRRYMPHILGVTGFTGIRFHPGNVVRDVEGCVAVGKSRYRQYLAHSVEAFEVLFEKIAVALDHREEVTVALAADSTISRV